MKTFKAAYKEIKADSFKSILDVYEKVRSKNSIILQSGQKGDYSIIGFEPLSIKKFTSSNIRYTIYDIQKATADFVNDIESASKLFKLALTLPFTGGALGFFTYDFGVELLGIKQNTKEDIKIPKAYFIFPGKIIVFNSETEELYLIAWAQSQEVADRKLEEIEVAVSDERSAISKHSSSSLTSEIKSNLNKKQYFQKIKEIKELLKAGETYQVNFSQRFSVDTQKDPFEIYKTLTKNNPSPYQLYLQTKDFSIISNSPERLFRVRAELRELRTEKRTSQLSALSSQFSIDSRPIKGTVPRGKTEQEDQQLIKELLGSKKEQAELDMITDLVRNDLGRICVEGSVEVNEDRVIESYGNVHHTVSNVKGTLKKSTDLKTILKAIFPGGSITGCPKLRTMKIIDELEEFKRTIYCGSAGYIDGRGNMDFNIMIRTIIAVSCKLLAISPKNQKPKIKNYLLYFHSGGGITIDSKTNDEYEETLHKAKAIIRAIG